MTLRVTLRELTDLAVETEPPCGSNPDLFFQPSSPEATRQAKRICATCEIADVCRGYALSNDERYGVWGGLGGADGHPRTRPRSRYS